MELNNKYASKMKLNAKRVCDLVDLHGWSLSAAKAEYKRLTGFSVKARSKDDFIAKLIEIQTL